MVGPFIIIIKTLFFLNNFYKPTMTDSFILNKHVIYIKYK